jgi:hypothetical protein
MYGRKVTEPSGTVRRTPYGALSAWNLPVVPMLAG